MTQEPLFPGMTPAPAQAPLKDPVEVTVRVSRDNPREDAVFVSTHARGLMWVPRRFIRFDGLGEQRVTIEKWKAKELGLI